MSTEETFAFGRVIERLLICTFGGISLALGWNLFRVGVVTQQAAELHAKGWRLNLKRVGPGVFFALFGAVVLSVSLRSPLSLPLQRSGDDPARKTFDNRDEKKGDSTVVYGHGENSELAKSWVASINTLEQLITKDKLPTSAEQKAVERSEISLGQLRDVLVMRQFGADVFRAYQSYRNTRSVTPGKVTQQDERRFAGIEAWMRADRIQE